MENYKITLTKITTFVFDVDGVLSDGKIWFPLEGDPIRNMHNKDGYALQLAIRKGYNVAIISGGSATGLTNRFNNLGIQHVYIRQKDKVECYEEYKKTTGLKDKEILFMGDDLPDHGVMQLVGLACCPADSAQEILESVHYISHKNGGEGCVRDVIEQVMRAQGTWEISGW